MYDRELDQRLDAMHDRGVHCHDHVLRLRYDANAAVVTLRGEGEGTRAVCVTYAGLARHLGAAGPGATGEFGPVERLLCAMYGDPDRYGAVEVTP
ncbi:hypothetical protein tb265_45910 [Gemmatimonadetes bacterium T265]|nr:hypothetical protein tb265_45910 [Gemmatimonadetes bacterium T265]